MGIIFDTSTIIAATAIAMNYTVVTINIRDFEKIPGIRVETLGSV